MIPPDVRRATGGTLIWACEPPRTDAHFLHCEQAQVETSEEQLHPLLSGETKNKRRPVEDSAALAIPRASAPLCLASAFGSLPSVDIGSRAALIRGFAARKVAATIVALRR